MTGVFIRKMKGGFRYRQRNTQERRACDNGGRDWSDVSRGPRMASNHWKLEEARKDSSLEPPVGT